MPKIAIWGLIARNSINPGIGSRRAEARIQVIVIIEYNDLFLLRPALMLQKSIVR
jgi:hypothetical protein